MDEIKTRLTTVRGEIEKVAVEAGRDPSGVLLLAVSKTRTPEEVRAAYDAGQRCFGENYLQDAREKIERLADIPLEWHFIGPLQSNKTRLVAELFDWVHTLDREKIAQRLNEQRSAEKSPLNVCVQVNVDEAETKSGVAPDELESLAGVIRGLPNLCLRGLMAIPDPAESMELQRRPFARLKACFESLNSKGFELDTLSMGMSDDMDAAILEGATMVRIGTTIFGPRQRRNPL